MTDKKNKDAGIDNAQDSLVDALESIKSLLAKSDSKLAAARESIAIASNQTALGKKDIHHEHSSEQSEIPVLDDIIIPAEVESATNEVSDISEQISEKIEETLAAVQVEPSSLGRTKVNPDPVIVTQHDPQITLEYIDTLQKKLDKTVRDSLMKSVVSIEKGLKKSLAVEFEKIRKELNKKSR